MLGHVRPLYGGTCRRELFGEELLDGHAEGVCILQNPFLGDTGLLSLSVRDETANTELPFRSKPLGPHSSAINRLRGLTKLISSLKIDSELGISTILASKHCARPVSE
jgi:hypothetical protein